MNVSGRQVGASWQRPGVAARGMTLVEMAIAVGLIGVGLFLLVGWMNGIRDDTKQELARRMLVDLDRAMMKYFRETRIFPPAPPPEEARNAAVQLMNNEKTRSILERLPASLRRGNGVLVDPWGTPLRYYPADSRSPYVLANYRRPVFVSAGPDREFGEHDAAYLGDDLRSDDPGPDGFWPHQAMQDLAAPTTSGPAGVGE